MWNRPYETGTMLVESPVSYILEFILEEYSYHLLHIPKIYNNKQTKTFSGNIYYFQNKETKKKKNTTLTTRMTIKSVVVDRFLFFFFYPSRG